MIPKTLTPTTPAAPPRQDPELDERTVPGRRLVAILSLVAVLPLPLFTVKACSTEEVSTSTGLELLTVDPAVAIATPLLLISLLLLARLGARLVTPGKKLLVGLAEGLLVAGLWLDVQLALMEYMFDTVEPLPAGVAALFLFGCLALDVAVTLVVRAWRFAQSIRRSRNHARAVSMAGSSGEIT